MNKDNARDYLPLVQALAEGKTIQVKIHNFEGNFLHWEDEDNPTWRVPAEHYRIKPEPKKGWYRVALWSGTLGCRMVTLAISDYEEKQCEDQRDFVRWITDRIEYTLPEGE